MHKARPQAKAKVVLVNPPLQEPGAFTIFGRKLSGVKQFKLPPLGLLSIAGSLESAGHEVSIMDADAENITIADSAREIAAGRPEVVGITANSGNYFFARELARHIRQESCGAKIVMGGPLPSSIPEFVVRDAEVDYVILGEGELSLGRLCSCISQKINPVNVAGMACLRNGKFVSRAPQLIANLDGLAGKAWHLVDVRKYRPHPASYRRLPAISTITSRGCPFSCIYCNRKIFGRTFRCNSVGRVREELEELKSYGVVDINFWDDVFTFNSKRTAEMCGMLKQTGLIWNCSTRVNLVNEKMLAEMARSGCYEIGYGIEAGSQRMLDFMKKGITKEQVRSALRLTKKAGLDVKAYFMIGFPGETREEIEKTIDFAIELDPDIASFNIVVPYPGSELFDMSGLRLSDVKFDAINYAELGLTASDRFSKDELRAFLKEAYRRFYTRPGYFFKALLSIKNVSDLSRYITAILTLT